jgi:hypothetical protein
MPIHQFAAEIVKSARKGANELTKGTMLPILKNIGFACEVSIQNAFASSGFGQWAPNTPKTIHRKKSASPLIDTSQLRRSISSAVVDPV